MLIAVDFDETCVTGPHDVPGAVEALKRITAAGHKVCLWTCRYPGEVATAMLWFQSHRIPLAGTNRWAGQGVSPSPKLVADLYLDDRAFGAPLTPFQGTHVLDWSEVLTAFEAAHLLEKLRGGVSLEEISSSTVTSHAGIIRKVHGLGESDGGATASGPGGAPAPRERA